MKTAKLLAGVLVWGMVQTACGDEDEKDDIQVEELVCAEGENPTGNGCLLGCKDGWRPNGKGGCAAACPPMTALQADGSCVLTCDPNETFSEARVDGSQEPRVGDTMALAYCKPPCPSHMTPTANACTIVCPEGWTVDTSGTCRLNCPEGTTPAADGTTCEFDVVGESKTCPDTPWDTTITGPGPLFVDPASGSESGDGTQAAPFATINQALAVSGEEATIYLAAGRYQEQVFVDYKKTFNLIGHCASDTHIIPSELAIPTTEQGASAGAVTTWWVDNVHIHGIMLSSPGVHGLVIRHNNNLDAVLPQNVQVDQMVVNDTDEIGVLIRGTFPQVTVTDTTVTKGQTGIYVVADDAQSGTGPIMTGEMLPRGLVNIHRNRVEGLTVSNSIFNVEGIYVGAADTLNASGNRIRNLVSAMGIYTTMVTHINLDKNILSNIDGYGAVNLMSSLMATAPTLVTATNNFIYDIAAGSCNGFPICGDMSVGISLDTLNGEGPVVAELSGNRFDLIQGQGLAIGMSYVPGNSVRVSGDEYHAISEGISAGSGDLTVVDSRFSKNWRTITGGSVSGYEPLGAVHLESNVFENRMQDPAGMPDTYHSTLWGTSVFITATVDRRSDTKVIGNLFADNKKFSMDLELFVLNVAGDTVTVEDNVFTNNEGASTYITAGTVFAERNFYFGNQSDMEIEQYAGLYIPTATIRDNLFMSKNGLKTKWLEQTGNYTVENNAFVGATNFIGTLSSEGISAYQLRIANNYFGASHTQAGAALDLAIENNVFEESRLVVLGQPKGGTGRVVGNLFSRSHLDVYQVLSPLSIKNNQLSGPSEFYYMGAGIGVYESTGPVSIVRNIIESFAMVNVPEIGPMGDGIQVVGSPTADVSNVLIEGNRIASNGRYGIILVNAEGRVQKNMYNNNGGGAAIDLVLATPKGSGYVGGDLNFADVPEIPPLVTLPENILADLR